MSGDFRVVEPYQLKDNVFKLIEKEWMLVAAGTPGAFNMMTASWGGWGSLWNRLVTFAFVRPQRYTYQFMESSAFFTLNFFTEQYHDALMFCGTRSGRDYDKAAKTGLTPAFAGEEGVYFEESRLVVMCRKIYAQDLDGEFFVDPAIDQEVYSLKDYHRMYIGEIVRCLVK